MQDEVVISLCGPYPKDYVDLDIASDPNFVFENDINFESVQLFDYDSNSVFVNSFLECAHYVNGGWSNSQIIETFPGDKYIFFAALALTALYGSYMYFAKMLNK